MHGCHCQDDRTTHCQQRPPPTWPPIHPPREQRLQPGELTQPNRIQLLQVHKKTGIDEYYVEGGTGSLGQLIVGGQVDGWKGGGEGRKVRGVVCGGLEMV